MGCAGIDRLTYARVQCRKRTTFPRRLWRFTGVSRGTYPYDALVAPITQTATYSFADTAELIAYFEGRKEREEYGRYGNPSVRLVEEKVASLEGTEDAVAFASGMAAVTSTILALVKSGSHVILFADCYRRTRQFVTMFLGRFGVSHTLIPPADVDALEEAIRPETRLVIAEAPTNPLPNDSGPRAAGRDL